MSSVTTVDPADAVMSWRGYAELRVDGGAGFEVRRLDEQEAADKGCPGANIEVIGRGAVGGRTVGTLTVTSRQWQPAPASSSFDLRARCRFAPWTHSDTTAEAPWAGWLYRWYGS